MLPRSQESSSRDEVRSNRPWFLRRPAYLQHEEADCAATCLRMVLAAHGVKRTAGELRSACDVGRQGASVHALGRAAESFGLRSLPARLPLDRLARAPLPCIVHWEAQHFLVVYEVRDRWVMVADPARGKLRLGVEEFRRGWLSRGADQARGAGVAVFFEPTAEFGREPSPREAAPLRRLVPYLRRQARLGAHVALGLLLGSILSLAFPLLTQTLVDVAFDARDLDLVAMVVVALAALTVGTTVLDVVRSRLLAHLASRVGLAMIADFVARLLALPVAFFEARRLGDLLEKVSDHRRVDDLLAGSSLSVVFGALQLVSFGGLLFIQSTDVALTFVVGTIVGIGWVLAWAPARRRIDQRRFTAQARSQALLIEMVTGVVDLKLAGAETAQRQRWERKQVRLFGVTMDALAVDQAQRVGAQCLNDLKNLAVTWVAVRAVMEGRMSLGALVATQYVVGQLNAPIRELLGFVQRIQDVSLALERADDAHREPTEQLAGPALVNDVARDADLELVDVGFTYPGPDSHPVLQGVSLRFAAGRMTAIVGSSGSGKTTLLKLLLGLHHPSAGRVTVGGVDLRSVSLDAWRGACGVVMQDGRIFDATVLANVALGDPDPDARRALDALTRAQLGDWLGRRALGLATRLGAGGEGLSQGQRQRLLIARALYRDPAYLFLDEATSALDANNERAILEVLEEVLAGKTSVVIAHRLSTVRRADRIVVIEQGRVVEAGTHAELIARDGAYLRLVKNQLELGAAA